MRTTSKSGDESLLLQCACDGMYFARFDSFQWKSAAGEGSGDWEFCIAVTAGGHTLWERIWSALRILSGRTDTVSHDVILDRDRAEELRDFISEKLT